MDALTRGWPDAQDDAQVRAVLGQRMVVMTVMPFLAIRATLTNDSIDCPRFSQPLLMVIKDVIIGNGRTLAERKTAARAEIDAAAEF